MKHVLSSTTALLIAAMATGTVVEKLHGATVAQDMVYHSWWFIALWGLLAASAIAVIIINRSWKRPSILTLHAALVVILAGSLTTHIGGTYGTMKLSPGVPTASYTDDNDSTLISQLPFTVELQSFDVARYPGSMSPMDFVSVLTVSDAPDTVTISMNNIYKHHGYRFYQADYDDEGNSVLQVAHDPAGIALTYAGYVLLLLGLILLLTEPQGSFRKLLRSPILKRGSAVIALLLLTAVGVSAAPVRTLPKETADKMGQIYVNYRGRVCPLQTLAKDFTTKLCGKATYQGLTAEQVFSGWLFYYGLWEDEPMLKIKGSYVQEALGIDGKYARMADFIDPTGADKLTTITASLPKGDPRRKKYRAADEKYNLIGMLTKGQLLKIFPLAGPMGSIKWYSHTDELPLTLTDDEYTFIRKQLSYCTELALQGDYSSLDNVFEKIKLYQEQRAGSSLPTPSQYKAERWYNRLSTGRWLSMTGITLGLLFFGFFIFTVGRKGREVSIVRTIAVLWMVFITLYTLALFILRWIAGAHIPLAGSYDTMVFLCLCIGVVTLIAQRRYDMALPFGMLISGLVLLVAMMGGANPPVTRLMPVLSSPLLSLHVTVIMIAYALVFFTLMNGLAAVVMRALGRGTEELERMRTISLIMLYPAVALLSIGIFIGAVWANVSWGNYWAWDPKEVWALITLLVYTIPLYSDVFRVFRKPMVFHIYNIAAFLSVLITYFGVNLILGGIHAYN